MMSTCLASTGLMTVPVFLAAVGEIDPDANDLLWAGQRKTLLDLVEGGVRREAAHHLRQAFAAATSSSVG